MSACYRSNHPDVLGEWEDSDRRYRKAHAAISAFSKKYDAQAMAYRGELYRLAALIRDDVPEGGDALWRRDRKAGGWVPRRNSKAGKAIATEFDACSARGLGNVPGLPRYVRDTTQMFSFKGPGMFWDHEYVWACWMHCDHEDVLKSEWGTLDETMWEPVKRSEFYAAQEAQEKTDV
jgi:hypothetical protein